MGQRIDLFKQQLAFDDQRSLYDYWYSKCRPGALPGRRDLHPRDLIRFLPFITLVDVEQGAQKRAFKVRLAGTGLRNVLDTEITGRALDELPLGNALSHWRQIHDRLVDEGKPLCGVSPLIWHGGRGQASTALAQVWVKFPLAETEAKVSTILAYDIFMPACDLSPALQNKFIQA